MSGEKDGHMKSGDKMKNESFLRELEVLLHRHGKLKGSKTSAMAVAEYLNNCLEAYYKMEEAILGAGVTFREKFDKGAKVFGLWNMK